MARSATTGLALVLVIATCTAPAPDPNRAATLTALAQMQTWLDGARPVSATAFGFECLDAWTWFMFSEWHPDAQVRASAAAATDTRLRALRAPTEWTQVTLSYWALALRLMAHRALPIDAQMAQLAEVDLTATLAAASPTTRWWTLTLLHQAGASGATPDVGETFLATQAARGPVDRPSSLTDVYNLYHEIAPAAGLGLAPITGFSAAQLDVARKLALSDMDFAATAGDTDALAEALVTGALLDRRNADSYRAGIRVLLGKQNPDGTFQSGRDAHRRPLDTDHYRHVVVVSTFALLTSLAEYEPARDD